MGTHQRIPEYCNDSGGHMTEQEIRDTALEEAARIADRHWPESGHVSCAGAVSCPMSISIMIRRLKSTYGHGVYVGATSVAGKPSVGQKIGEEADVNSAARESLPPMSCQFCGAIDHAPHSWPLVECVVNIRSRLSFAETAAEGWEERAAKLEGHLLGIQLWAREESDRQDTFTRRNGGQVVKPNVFDSLAERIGEALEPRHINLT